ncbi:MAG TPA: peptidylprolyl isomerase [Bacteroidetes bacterium]|nr:peptidylprolyl isomerase [Bacteroidota bacterium]
MKSDSLKTAYRIATISLLFLLMVPITMQGQAKKKKIKPDAIIYTDFGEIKIKLYEDTPLHRNNFLKLAKEGMYDGTTFHRIIKKFMIQGGDPYSKDPDKKNMAGQGGPGYTLPAEIRPTYYHKKGALAAARMSDQVNPKRESSGSQFYLVEGKTMTAAEIANAEKRLSQVLKREFKYTDDQKSAYMNIGGTPWLDQQYTVFGEVIEGLDVIDKIAAVETMPGDRPKVDVSIRVVAKARVKKIKKKKKKKKKAKK